MANLFFKTVEGAQIIFLKEILNLFLTDGHPETSGFMIQESVLICASFFQCVIGLIVTTRKWYADESQGFQRN